MYLEMYLARDVTSSYHHVSGNISELNSCYDAEGNYGKGNRVSYKITMMDQYVYSASLPKQ